jgi:hypothetical protein
MLTKSDLFTFQGIILETLKPFFKELNTIILN